MEHKAANRAAPLHQRTQRTSHNRRAPMAPASKRPAAAPPLSDYEVKRARNVEENEQVLLALGIEPAVPRAPAAPPPVAASSSSSSAASSSAAPKDAGRRGRISETALWAAAGAAAAPPPPSPAAAACEDECACTACGWDDDEEGNELLLCEGRGAAPPSTRSA